MWSGGQHGGALDVSESAGPNVLAPRRVAAGRAIGSVGAGSAEREWPIS